MTEDRKKIGVFLLACWLLLIQCSAGVDPDVTTRFDETDLNRILYSVKEIGKYPAGTFFVFLGLDKDNKIHCEPLSGARKSCNVPPEWLRKIGYGKDTQPFEIAMDTYKLFADYKSSAGRLTRRKNLTQVLGKQDLIVPLMEMENKEKECISIFQKHVGQYKTNFHRDFRKKNNVVANNGFEEDDAKELIEKLCEEINPSIQFFFELIDKTISSNNLLLSMSLFLHLQNFWADMENYRYEFMYNKNYLFEEVDNKVNAYFDQCFQQIIKKLKEQYKNISFTSNRDEFISIFPNSHGLWDTSPPFDPTQLKVFFNRFYAIRKDRNNYSMMADFENWGNCQLSILLCTQNVSDANYLTKEFQEALKKYKENFHKRKNEEE